jgi:hypothetical protein
MAVVLNPDFGNREVAVAAGVRMLKNPLVSMAEILEFIDNEVLVNVPDEDVEAIDYEVALAV